MVQFTDRSSVYYFRDPRRAQPVSNQFYYDNYGSPAGTGAVYNPTAYNYSNPSFGISPQRNNVFQASTIPGVTGQAGTIAQRLAAGTILDTANYAINGSGFANNFNYPSTTRLNNNNLPFGADYANASTEFFSNGEQSLDDEQEKRVTITDPSKRFLNGQIVQPLQDTFGVLFPYTPTISINHTASYDSTPLTHANYDQPFYQHSTVSNINISGPFTASNYDEAKYLLAVIHFFRSVTKMFYGQDSLAGTPPPILFLDGYGPEMLNHIPVVVTSFQTQLPDNVDYISTQAGGNYTNVPTEMRITVDLKPVYSRNQISNNFGLEKYVSGQLLSSRGFGQSGPGGFI